MRTAVDTADVRETGTLVGGNQLRYLTAGDGEQTIVLLHGGIIDAANVSWGGLIGPLSEHARVVAPDLLGYGWSDKPDGPYSQRRHARTINTFLETLDAETVDIVGTSMGAGIGIDVAMRSPERVRRLVAADSYGLGTDLPDGKVTFLRSRLGILNKLSLGLLRRRRDLTKASLSGIVTDVDALDEAIVDAIYELLQIDGIGRAYRSWRAYEVGPGGFRTHYYTDLDELSMPVLYIHGEHDEVFPVEWSERAAEITPNGSFERFADCAHWAPREAPERFLDSVRSFLT